MSKPQEIWAIQAPDGEVIEGTFSSDKKKCHILYWCETSTEPMPKGLYKLWWMCEMKAKGFKEVKFVRADHD